MTVIVSLLTGVLNTTISNVIKEQKWRFVKNWLIRIYSTKYITPLVNALSIYESNISNINDMLDNKTENYITDNILNICYELLNANEFWIRNCLDTKYMCINELIYDLQTPYKNDRDCLIELFQQSWNNIFQYISLNQDVLKNTFRKELDNIMEEITKFGIKLPKQYTYITSDDDEKLKQCYVFAHKQFVNSNIDKIINYSKKVVIDWCKNNRSNYPYKANVYQYLFINSNEIELYTELYKDILKIYLSNNIDGDNRILQQMIQKFIGNNNHYDIKSVLKVLGLIHDEFTKLIQFEV